jgi:hypothetical protein
MRRNGWLAGIAAALALAGTAACGDDSGGSRDEGADPGPDADATDGDALAPDDAAEALDEAPDADAVPDSDAAEALDETPDADVSEVPDETASSDTERIAALLVAAAGDVLFTSESDYPFTVVVVPGAASTPITAADVKDRLAPIYVARPSTMPLAGRAVEVTTVDAVLVPRITPAGWWTDYEREVAAHLEALRTVLNGEVHDVQVFRIGPPDPFSGLAGDIDVFFIGASDEGDLVGVWTVSIET